MILSVEIFSATSTVAYAVLLTKSSKSKKSDGLLPVRLGLQKNGREPNRYRWAPSPALWHKLLITDVLASPSATAMPPAAGPAMLHLLLPCSTCTCCNSCAQHPH
jgi:hypothetical protein